jgi:hypothetical protein
VRHNGTTIDAINTASRCDPQRPRRSREPCLNDLAGEDVFGLMVTAAVAEVESDVSPSKPRARDHLGPDDQAVVLTPWRLSGVSGGESATPIPRE